MDFINTDTKAMESGNVVLSAGDVAIIRLKGNTSALQIQAGTGKSFQVHDTALDEVLILAQDESTVGIDNGWNEVSAEGTTSKTITLGGVRSAIKVMAKSDNTGDVTVSWRVGQA